MPCEQSQLLSPYLDGELSAAEASAVSRHLSSCAECSAEADEIRAVSRLIAAARVHLGPSASDTTQVLGRLRLHVQDLVGSADTSLIWMARVFSGVAASILLGGIWMLTSASKTPTHVSLVDGPAIQVSLTPDPVIDFSPESAGAVPTGGLVEPTTRESVLARLTGIADTSNAADPINVTDPGNTIEPRVASEDESR